MFLLFIKNYFKDNYTVFNEKQGNSSCFEKMIVLLFIR